MSRHPSHPVYPCLLLAVVALIPVGCGQSFAPPAAQQPAAPRKPPSDGAVEIELFEPKVTIRDAQTVAMEVSYKYTKGESHPDRFYNLELRFPETNNAGVKTMVGADLRTEGGIIKDWFTAPKPGAKSFEICLLEAPAPAGPYKRVSNVVKGTREPPAP